MDVRLLPDARSLLDVAGDALRASGAEGEVSLGLQLRLVDDPHAWGPDVHLAVAEEAGEPVAVATITGNRPVLIVGFVDERDIDFDALALALHDHGARPRAVNGAVRVSVPFAQAWAQLPGVTLGEAYELRAFELRTVVAPRQVAGRMEVATAGQRDQLIAWSVAFGDDIDEPMTRSDAARLVDRLIPAGDLATWSVDGRPVSMAAVNRRTPSAANVALVYTPGELRGNGYASAVVAELSQRELDAGSEYCTLFTDLANPTSNHIYAEIGYEPRCDFRVTSLAWGDGS